MHYLCLTRITSEHSVKGGMEVHQKVLAEGLVKKGHQVTVITTRGSDGFVGERAIEGVKYIFTDTPKIQSFAKWNPLWYDKKSKLIETIHARTPIDLAWAEGGSAYGAVTTFQKCKIPYIPIAQGTIPGDLLSYFRQIHSVKDWLKLIAWVGIKGYLWIRYEIGYLKKAAHVIMVSNELKEEMCTYYGLNKSHISVVFNGVSPESFFPDNTQRIEIRRQLSIPDDAFVAVSAGRIIREKGFQFGIQALKEVVKTNPNTFLVIIGKGVDEEYLKNLSKELKVFDNVRFVGFVAHKEMNAYYNAADCMIAATLRNEGFPLIFCEAMLAGLPIIASSYGGNPSAVTHNETGILLKHVSTESVSHAWTKVLNEESFRKVLRENALEKANRLFTDVAMLENTVSIFHEYSSKIV